MCIRDSTESEADKFFIQELLYTKLTPFSAETLAKSVAEQLTKDKVIRRQNITEVVVESNGVGPRPRKFKDTVIEPYRPRVIKRKVLKTQKKIKQEKQRLSNLEKAYARGSVDPAATNRMNLAEAYARGGVKVN